MFLYINLQPGMGIPLFIDIFRIGLFTTKNIVTQALELFVIYADGKINFTCGAVFGMLCILNTLSQLCLK